MKTDGGGEYKINKKLYKNWVPLHLAYNLDRYSLLASKA